MLKKLALYGCWRQACNGLLCGSCIAFHDAAVFCAALAAAWQEVGVIARSVWGGLTRCVLHHLLLPQGAPRLLFMRAFAHLFEGKPSGLNTVNILRSMPHLTQLRAAINQTIIDDFTAAREAVRVSHFQCNSYSILHEISYVLASSAAHLQLPPAAFCNSSLR